MRVLLIGHPVAHSKSPLMQNAAFEALGLLAWRYELCDTPLENLAERVAFLRHQSDIAGANVTIPHKQAVLPLLDALSPAAQSIGAVNTIFKRGGVLIGDNTDWLGFLADLEHHGVNVGADTRALVLGAGGSARAVAYALCQRGARVWLHNRTHARAQALAEAMGSQVQVCSSLSDVVGEVALVVNCTSLGMWPRADQSPWDERVPMLRGAVLYDLVYNPPRTRLMQQAEQAGLRAINGLGMLAEQGAAAFALWTGVPAARVSSIMRHVLASHA
ncbi:MAG: shikimate dehydrogenase [Thermoflexales bacterium]